MDQTIRVAGVEPSIRPAPRLLRRKVGGTVRGARDGGEARRMPPKCGHGRDLRETMRRRRAAP
jgi:hypothetical protein